MRKIIAIIIIVMLLIAIRNIIISIQRLQEERVAIEHVKQELADKKKESEFLREQLSYVKSNEFVEIEAREKLGMVKQNEYLVVASASSNSQDLPKPLNQEPNWKKWWRLFF